jgi:hypothetical protein
MNKKDHIHFWLRFGNESWEAALLLMDAIKMHPSGTTADNFDPFISLIEQTGRVLEISTSSA